MSRQDHVTRVSAYVAKGASGNRARGQRECSEHGPAECHRRHRAKASCIFGCLVVMDSPTPLVAHRSPPHPRRLDRNKRCNVVYLTTWIFFFKKVTLKDTKAKKKSQDKKVRMI